MGASDPLAGEPGSGQASGTFTFSRTGSTTAALTVNFTLGGTATGGTDYAPLGPSVTFAAGSATATGTVDVLDDSEVEGDESVWVALAPGSGYTVSSPNSAAVTITDDDGAPMLTVDDAGPCAGVTVEGAWTPSAALPGFWGVGYQHDGNTGKGTKSFGFRPNLPTAGRYHVYLWWTANAQRASNVPVDVVHRGGTTVVGVNQRANGSRWNLLGTWDFGAGPAGQVVLRTTWTDGYVAADGVKFVPEGCNVVDDFDQASNLGSVTYVGDWPRSTGVPGYWDCGGYHHDGNTGKGSKSAEFRPNLAQAGQYEVALWYRAHAGRANNVPVDVVHSEGTSTVPVNQQINGAQWVMLGTYPFAAGTSGNVRVRNAATSGLVVADAVRFRLVPRPAVTVVASDATAGEPATGLGSGTFTFSRSGSTAAALTVDYTVGGTAGSGADYTAIGTSVTFAAGSATATKTVTAIDDFIVEGDETVVVTLAAGTGSGDREAPTLTMTTTETSPYGAASPGAAAATLAVVQDTIGPLLLSAGALASETGNTFDVGVTFNEAVTAASAGNAANYTLSAGTVLAVRFCPGSMGVVLKASGLTVGNTYTVTVANVVDLMGNSMTSASKEFKISPLKWGVVGADELNLGNAVLPVAANGFDIYSDAIGSWDTYDEATFVFEEVTGDFDKVVQVEYQDSSSQWARAGLIARDVTNFGVDRTTQTAGAAGRYQKVHVTPVFTAMATPGSNCWEGNRRLSTGGSTTSAGGGGGPLSYPNTWCRLQRVGDVFTIYRSTDGLTWIPMGTTTFPEPIPSKLFVGPEFSPENANLPPDSGLRNVWLARFRNYGDYIPVGSPNSATVTIKDDDAPSGAWRLTVDDAAPCGGVTVVGTWTTSTALPGYWGTALSARREHGQGDQERGVAAEPAGGGAVSRVPWWTANAQRASNVPVDVQHSGGTQTVTVNQRLNGSRWNLLGTWDFGAGSAGQVVIRTTGTDGFVTADGVKFVPEGCNVVDDFDQASNLGSVTYVGDWPTSAGVAGYWDCGGYHHDGNTGKGSKSAEFRPNLAAAGQYEVAIWYTAHAGRANNVPVDVVHSGGTTTVLVNQQLNGGQWVVLGTYTFAAGTPGYVRIRNAGTSGVVVADAVRFCPVAPTEVIVDDNDATGVTVVGTWTPSTGVPGYYDAGYLHDGNTGKGSKSVDPAPDAAGGGDLPGVPVVDGECATGEQRAGGRGAQRRDDDRGGERAGQRGANGTCWAATASRRAAPGMCACERRARTGMWWRTRCGLSGWARRHRELVRAVEDAGAGARGGPVGRPRAWGGADPDLAASLLAESNGVGVAGVRGRELVADSLMELVIYERADGQRGVGGGVPGIGRSGVHGGDAAGFGRVGVAGDAGGPGGAVGSVGRGGRGGGSAGLPVDRG